MKLGIFGAGSIGLYVGGRIVAANATEAQALAGCDVVLCCVKSQHTEEAARSLAAVLPKGVTVVSLQNEQERRRRRV